MNESDQNKRARQCLERLEREVKNNSTSLGAALGFAFLLGLEYERETSKQQGS